MNVKGPAFPVSWLAYFGDSTMGFSVAMMEAVSQLPWIV